METINTTPERIMAAMTDVLESIWHTDHRINDKNEAIQKLAAKVATYSTREMMYGGGMCFNELQRQSDNLRNYASEMRGLVRKFGSLCFLCEIASPITLREELLPELIKSDDQYQERGRDMLLIKGMEIYIREACD
jgi:hypothetical protein